MIRKVLFILFGGIILPMLGFTQVINDECITPIELPSRFGSFCSEPFFLTNEGSTHNAAISKPSCWPGLLDDQPRDVWFTFVSAGNAANISMIGNVAQNPGGTLTNPQLAIYEDCSLSNQIACASDFSGANVVEVLIDQLTLGQRYFIRCSARGNRTGTFQLCIDGFFLKPSPQSDCNTAVLLCDKSPFTVESLEGIGLVTNEVDRSSCIESEFASAWYKWVCETPGTLTFTLTPNNPTDDLDFIVYELPGGIDDCNNKVILRCMASGENVGAPPADFARCMGPTGLRLGETDISEFSGCANAADNNFVRELDMEAGKTYVLIVNNFSKSGNGFDISFGGTGTFLGPKAEINVLAGQNPDSITCDKSFSLEGEVDFPTGNIQSISWNFGVDAAPATGSGTGPFEVTYSSIGRKFIVMNIETERGCLYSESVDFEVLPCCEDFDPLVLGLDSIKDLTCFGDGSGVIDVDVITGGFPFFEYSMDQASWQISDIFGMLSAGVYNIYARDRKGCVDSLSTTVSEPPQLIVDAGPDQTIQLGCGTEITATTSPIGRPVLYDWNSEQDQMADTLDTPNISIIPPGTSAYEIVITDEDGCMAVDTVVIFVDKNRPVYIPNAFSPNNDGINDYFYVFGNKAMKNIELIQVFDRWGNSLFKREDIPMDNTIYGWDGTADGAVLTPGTYTYLVKVQFVDNSVLSFSGDVYLIK